MNNDLIYRLRKRAEIRRQIPGRKSVENGEPDRIADLLEEAADEIEHLKKNANLYHNAYHCAVDINRQAMADAKWFMKECENLRSRIQELEVQLYGSR